MDPSVQILSDITVHMKYARYLPEKKRRETWEELVDRNKAMHIEKFPQLKDEIENAYRLVYEKKVLPSMRSMQFAGKPIDINPTRIYNCSYLPVDHPDAFSETMYLLLGGCFSGETLVKTYTGDKRIDEITNEDVVLTYDKHSDSYEWTRPLAAGETPTEDKEKIELEFEDGTIIRCTEDHKFLTSNRGWVEAKDLEETDDIVGLSPLEMSIRIKRKTMIEDKSKYYDLSIPVTHNYVLANGAVVHNTGVGYSVQTQHIAKLPPILGVTHPEGRQRKKRYLIGDSIEGWADAVKMLVESYFYGKREIDFDFRDIRPKGAQLVTSGGKAPGPEPLREALVKIQTVFETAIQERGKGTRLKPIEAHDIQCHIADAVLAGGIRRAAMISGFSFDDHEMRAAKVGNWWENHPERGRANNSAVIVRNKVKKKEFEQFWNLIEASGSGEPGIFFTDDIDGDWFGNPCMEISLRPFQFCNLTEINASNVESQEDLNERAKAAAIIGTLQASYTDFHYLRDIWQETTEKEALLGVSMTGIASGAVLDMNLEEASTIVKDTNAEWSEKLGIRQAARTTAIKPAGCMVPETKIKTNLGDMSLEEIFEYNGYNYKDYDSGTFIEPKEKLFVYDMNNEPKLVEKLYVNGPSEENYTVEMEDGVEVTCTPWHKFLTVDRGWVRADELTEEDDIVNHKTVSLKIKKITKTNKESVMLDIEVEDTHSYQLSNGVVTHNTTSLVLGSSSGIHGWWDPFYIRRIRVGKNEAIYKYLSKNHPELLEDELFRPDSIAVISVPQKAPEGAIYRQETPIEMLERVKKFNIEWVAGGHRTGVNKNNVSCTVNIKNDEWEEVGKWLWNNRNTYTGISVLPYDGGTYKQAPFETTDEKTYKKMYKHLSNVDLTQVMEETDETELSAELACGPSGCDVTGSSAAEKTTFSFDQVSV